MIKRTKIVATLSVQRCTEELVRSLFKAGMNIVRINSAHASLENAAEIIRMVRSVSNSIPVMLDTKGPEIRVTRMDDAYPDGIRFAAGDRVKVRGTSVKTDIPSTREVIYMNVEHIVRDVPAGATMLIADGEMELHVEQKSAEELVCRVMRDCTLRSRKSVNVPNVSIDLPSVTEKDRMYIEWATENRRRFHRPLVDAPSARDVEAVQAILDSRNSGIKIISKIENQEGIDNIDEIIEASYGIMVARGDLGVELPAEIIPITQRMIVDKCIAAKRPVIIATQMLYSMVGSPRPTRAEVSDVASAIYERVDAVMLSDETASGAYPVESVETMARIAKAIERDEAYSTPFIDIHMVSVNHEITAQIARSAVRASTNLPIRAILLDTLTGRTGRYIASVPPDDDRHRGLLHVAGAALAGSLLRRHADSAQQEQGGLLSFSGRRHGVHQPALPGVEGRGYGRGHRRQFRCRARRLLHRDRHDRRYQAPQRGASGAVEIARYGRGVAR